MKITSLETLDASAADLVRLRINLTQAKAALDAETTAVAKRHQERINLLTDDCAQLETRIHDYCDAHRAEVLGDKKSRETPLCVLGYRLSTRVEPANRKIKWADVVQRLQRLVWGEAYLKYKEPSVNKDALHADKDQLTPEALAAAGVRFVSEDTFYLEAKPETAQ